MGYEQSVKGSNSNSLNIATLTIAALLQKNPLAPRVEHSLRSWTYIACLDVRSFDSLRSKRFRGVSAQISMFWPRENWGESKKERGGRGRGEKDWKTTAVQKAFLQGTKNKVRDGTLNSSLRKEQFR